MDLETQFAPDILLALPNPDIVSHFTSLLEATTTSQRDNVTKLHSHILSKVHDGAIPPFIFTIWLPLVLQYDPSIIRSVLLDDKSQSIRFAGIKVLRRTFRGKQWKKEGWDILGGATGLREIFEVFGVWEVKELARAIGAGSTHEDPEKAAAIEELVQMMIPSLVQAKKPSSDTPDPQVHWRPLLPELILLVRRCSSQFLAGCLSNPCFPSFLVRKVVCGLGLEHHNLLRMIAIGSVEVNLEVRQLVLRSCLKDLISSTVPWKPEHIFPAVSSGMPPGMRFCLDLIYEVRINPPPRDCLDKNVLLGHIITTMDLATRHKVPFRDILELLELGISAVDTRAGSPIKVGDPLLTRLIHYWAAAAFPDVDHHIDLGISPTARKRLLTHPSRPKPEHRDSLEALLVQVIKAAPSFQIQPSTLNRTLHRNLFARLKPEFPSAAKLPLIKLFCRHLAEINIDLDSDVTSENELLRVKWDIAVVNALPVHDAKWLFERALSMRPVKQVITSDISPWGKLLLSEDKAPYVAQLLDIKWKAMSDPTGDQVKPMARKILAEVEKKAERVRDADERLELSQLAVDTAIISNSARLLKEVSEWARRFQRDPVVGKSLPQYIFSDRTAPLLSLAVSGVLKSPVPLSTLSSLIEDANSLLSFHLQTALLALREPSFKEYTYIGILNLIRRVVSQRINSIKSRLSLGLEREAELVKVFLESLTPIILDFERSGTAEGHEQLGWDEFHGPLNDLTCPGSPSDHVLRFLDDLARKRDALWNHVRLEREPKVAALGPGWPKGLPVQSLLPSEKWTIAAVRSGGTSPFVAARVEEVVFCDPKIVSQPITDDTDGTGPFSEDLRFAIKCYVGRSPTSRESKLLKVWDHYSKTVLSEPPHLREFGEWLSDFAESIGSAKVARKIKYLVKPPPRKPNPLPAVGGGAVEWDPWPEARGGNTRSTSPVNTEPPTILLCQFHARSWNNTLCTPFCKPPSWRRETKHEPKLLDIWEFSRAEALPLSTQEAIVVSALLYLDSLNSGSGRLLSKPFPEGSSRPRYPSVYLDYEFLSAMGKSSTSPRDAVGVLRQLLSIVPPTLVQQLAESLLKSLAGLPETSTKYATLQETAFGVVALLPLSDRPSLAINFGLRIVKDMPDASAWHRQIISLRLGRQVGHEDAQKMMSRFAAFIVDALENQRKGGKVQQEVEQESDGDIDMLSEHGSDDIEMVDKDAPSAPKAKAQIKITTVKMLPQLLTLSNFTSLDFARSKLVTLYSASHQTDVRRAVAGALLELLRKFHDMGSSGSEQAYAALVPLSAAATGPGERMVTTEAQWLEAEKGGPLPVVDTERPLYKFFIEEMSKLLPSEFHERHVREIVLPLIAESSKQHNRWMRIFLGRLELSPEEQSVADFGPFGAVDSGPVDAVMVHWRAYVPKSYLVQARSRALSHLICRKLERVNDKLAIHDTNWRATEEGKYWVRYLTASKAGHHTCSWRVTLEDGVTTLIKDGITDQDLIDEFCAQAAILIRQPFSFNASTSMYSTDYSKPYSKISLDHFDQMFSKLQVPAPSGYMSPQIAWKLRVRPIIQRIADDIESIRTSKSWSENPSREPAILPPRMQLEAKLLPFPHIDLDTTPWTLGEVKSPKEKQEIYLSHVLTLLDEIVSSPSCRADYKWLTDIMRSVHVTQEDRLALVFGLDRSLEADGDSFKDCLKVELIQGFWHYLKSMSDTFKKEKVKEMLERWKKSPNEWVRSVAWTNAGDMSES
ncbi:hypothetical protein FQN54_005500 [Arachnomyces sp. PD_36]|nr:hypothetical protein FQN54_005500 [Arachnomyces sp. PD_36]